MTETFKKSQKSITIGQLRNGLWYIKLRVESVGLVRMSDCVYTVFCL